MKVDGINLTSEIIDQIQFWQQKETLEADIQNIDNVISFIACPESADTPKQVKHVLDLISNLCILKNELKSFNIKQYEQ